MLTQQGEHRVEQLLESFSFWRAIAEQSTDMVILLDAAENVLYASQSVHKWTGRVPASLEEWIECVHSEYRMDMRYSWAQMRLNEQISGLEFQLPEQNGESVWMHATWHPIALPNGPEVLYALLIRDISEQKKRAIELLRLAYHDPLTGLANRRLFNDHLVRMMAHAKRNRLQLAVMCLDIDNFKEINDSKGHDVGDQFLKVFAQRVGKTLRETDLLARMGGDEFMVVLTDVDSELGVKTVAGRMLTAIREVWEIGRHRFAAKVSIGIAMYPGNGEDYTSLLKNVDIALYQIKHSGGDDFAFYHSSMTMKDTSQRQSFLP